MVLALKPKVGTPESITPVIACDVGCSTVRRPLISSSVLPWPKPRSDTVDTSPRAALPDPPPSTCSLNVTPPSCGMDRNRSPPDTAATASTCSWPTTLTGSAPVVFAPLICVPTTTISAPSLPCGSAGRGAGATSDMAPPTCISAKAIGRIAALSPRSADRLLSRSVTTSLRSDAITRSVPRMMRLSAWRAS